MAKITPEEWATARALYEAGTSLNAVHEQFGISRAALQKRAKTEGWAQDAEPVIQRKVAEKVAGIVAAGHSEKRLAAIDAEADRRAEVVHRHRQEWLAGRELLYAGISASKLAITRDDKALAFDALKAAKIALEAMSILQAGEAKAWGIAPVTATRGGTESVSQELTVQVVYAPG